MPIRNYIHNFLWIVLKTLFLLFYGVSPYLLYSEGKLYSSTSLYFSTFAFHIEVTPLTDGTYELTQEPDGDFSSEALANVIELTEAPNFDSEEPKFTDPTDNSTGKPRSIILLFQNYATYRYYLLVHLNFWN